MTMLTSTNDADTPDLGTEFAVLWPDGRIDYHHTAARTGGRPIHHALRAAVLGHHDGTLGTQGIRPLRAWFTDDFTGLPRNPLADRILATAVGYHHPTGWHGPVALTSEDDPHTGDRPALDPATLTILNTTANTL